MSRSLGPQFPEDFGENGLHERVAVKKPLLCKANIRKRLDFRVCKNTQGLDSRSMDESTLDR